MVSLTQADALTAMSSPGRSGSGRSGETRMLSARNRRELAAALPSLTARGYACNQVAVLVSSSHPEATLVLLPASHAAP
jgi:hypothetical protein